MRTYKICLPKGVSLYSQDTLTLIQKEHEPSPTFWSIKRGGDKYASIFGICATKGRRLILTERSRVLPLKGEPK